MKIINKTPISPKATAIVVAVLALCAFLPPAFNLIAGAKVAPVIRDVKTQAVIAVAVSTVESKPMHHRISLTGSVSARDDLAVGAQANGLQIKQVMVEEGDNVKKGQLLATLDNEVLKAQLAQEEASLASSEASYQKSLQPNTSEEIAQQEAAALSARAAVERNKYDVKKAESEYKNSATIAKRYSGLHREGGSSDEETEQKITNAETALASLNSAKQSLDEANQSARQAQEKLHQLQRGGRAEDIRIAKATVAQHAARIQELKADLEQTFVRAPADGLITERDAHIGDISTSTKTLFKMTRSGELEMAANLSQNELSLVHEGQEANITDGSKSVVGHVWLISPTVDSNSRLGKVRIKIPSGKGFLQGMFVTASIESDTKQALAIPESAVQSDSDHLFTYVVRDGVCHKTWIKTGDQSDGLVEVIAGLKKGDQVITDGVSLVNDNDRVSVAQGLDEVVK
ncbi:MAG TPA: efflux RND transporter periplasmic adaptor subunit [Oculatellaceae cyanobacterium]